MYIKNNQQSGPVTLAWENKLSSDEENQFRQRELKLVERRRFGGSSRRTKCGPH